MYIPGYVIHSDYIIQYTLYMYMHVMCSGLRKVLCFLAFIHLLLFFSLPPVSLSPPPPPPPPIPPHTIPSPSVPPPLPVR